MCYLSKKPLKYFSFCDTLAHGDVVVGFAIFHIVLFQKKKKKKKRKEKMHSIVCESWWAPGGIG
jgi:hypothetical protein